MPPLGCGLCGAYVVEVAVTGGVIVRMLVAVCSACAGAIRDDVTKRRVAACTCVWARCGDGV